MCNFQLKQWSGYISYVVLQMYSIVYVYVSEDLQSSGPVHDTLLVSTGEVYYSSS